PSLNATPHTNRHPTIFPKSYFLPHLPAFTKWFLPNNNNTLNISYLLSHNSDPLLPVEITTLGNFTQSSLPWSALLGYLSAPIIHKDSPSIYLAQHPPPDV